MNSKLKLCIVSSPEILAKYDESHISERLGDFKKIENPNERFKRVTETYTDRLTRKKVLVRHIFKNEDGSETVTVTYLVHEGQIYVADRIS